MGTRDNKNEEELRALDTFVKLMRAANAVSERAHRHLPGTGLTETQFAVLEALVSLGPLFQRDIGRKILKSRANITLVVDNLEQRGLVRRERSKEDRRFMAVHLTETGRRLMEKVFPRHARILREEFSVLTAEEQEQLGRLCKKLGAGKR